MVLAGKVVFLLVVLLYFGCSRSIPAHLTATEMAELRSAVDESFELVEGERILTMKGLVRLERRMTSFVETRNVLVDDLFYALRRPCGSSFDRLYNEYKAVFILQVDPGVELCFAFDAESGVVSRAYIESGCE